ncbi:MAG: chromate transporter [Coriobacteriales bacterium]|nr:chromate transporter [Coriobacteriales bacterium]
MSKAQKLWILFSTSFAISAMANSGFAILAMMKRSFVNRYGWFSEEEMDDYVALVQGAPGPMGVNAALIVGYQVAGAAGALCAVLGCILPALLIMLLVTYFYEYVISFEYVRIFMTGMQMGVVAMLLDVLLGLFAGIWKKRKPHMLILVALAFVYVRFTKFSMVYLAAACIVVGLVRARMLTGEVEQ